MPIDYKKYPANWKTEIRPRILKRANNCCEFCGAQNYVFGFRDKEGTFYEDDGESYIPDSALDNQMIKIILAVAHLDHDETNMSVSDDRLAALCQRCHLQYDAIEKGKRRRKRGLKNQLTLF